MPIQINNKFYVSPKEAFEIVGQESYGQEWNTGFIENPESAQFKIVVKNLRASLLSSHVHAFLEDDGRQYPLTTMEAAGEFFQIDLKQNCVFLSNFPGMPLQCKIYAEELIAYVRSHRPKTGSKNIDDEVKVTNILVECVLTGRDIGTKKQQWERMKEQFKDLSLKGLGRARIEADKKLGKKIVTKAGRPKTPILS